MKSAIRPGIIYRAGGEFFSLSETLPTPDLFVSLTDSTLSQSLVNGALLHELNQPFIFPWWEMSELRKLTLQRGVEGRNVYPKPSAGGIGGNDYMALISWTSHSSIRARLLTR